LFHYISQIGSALPIAADADADAELSDAHDSLCDAQDTTCRWRRRWPRARNISRILAAVAAECFTALRSIDASGVMFDDFALELANVNSRTENSPSDSLTPQVPVYASSMYSIHMNPCFLSSPSLLAPFVSLCRLSLSLHSSCPHWSDDLLSQAVSNLVKLHTLALSGTGAAGKTCEKIRQLPMLQDLDLSR
jgi:hypothetical protein